jgi:nicotinate-nucleotide adenylyltransferase
MRLVGILGGTFDPIHFGHLRMAQELADALNLDEVRYIPAATPPHRVQPFISAQHRLEMVRLAIADNPIFLLDERELQRAEQDGNIPSYTIDTLISLRKELGEETAIHLLMGSDAFLGLPAWHRWQELLDYCHIIVAHRPGFAVTENMPVSLKAFWDGSATTQIADLSRKNAGHILMQPITPLDISATKIREDMKKNLIPRYLMPQSVIAYINENGLL